MHQIKLGKYRHYKGGEYELLFIGKNTENKDEVAVYRSLKDQVIWVRPLKMWLEKVEQKDKKVNRFELIAEQDSLDSWENKYKRALADYQNLLKSSAKEKQEFIRFALNDFLQEILPVYDHLKMSLNSLPDNEKESAWVKGVEYVLKQFKNVLNERGVQEIKTKGELFDHNLMEAVEGGGNMVKTEIMPGYTLHDKVIRPAKVIVTNKLEDKNKK
jgi:molecular chaperone GrpE